MNYKGYFNRFVCTGPFQRQLPVSGDVLPFLEQGGHLTHGKFYDLLLGREEEVRKPFLHLLFLKYQQLKIINMPK